MKDYLIESMTSYVDKLEKSIPQRKRLNESSLLKKESSNSVMNLNEDWSKGISFIYKVNTNSLIDAAKNNKVVIGVSRASAEELVAENYNSVRFRVPNSMMFGLPSYVNLSYGQSEIIVFWKDEDFRYKDIGGKSNFRKAKLTSEMNRFLEMGREELENCGVIVNQYKVEVGGSDKFNSTWRQAQPYNESLLLKEEKNKEVDEYISKLLNKIKDSGLQQVIRDAIFRGNVDKKFLLDTICQNMPEQKKEIEKLGLKESFWTGSRWQKRIARYDEFNNGNVFYSDWITVPDEEAEEMARQASIETPNKVFFVQYDDPMAEPSPNRYINGKVYDSNAPECIKFGKFSR